MTIILESEYEKEIDIDYEYIAQLVINETIDFVGCPYECQVNLTIVNNNTIKEINNEQRNIDSITDVLSFPMLEYESPANFENTEADISNFDPDSGELILGDIVISYDKVISQSLEYNHSAKREYAFLIAHSMLHLFGFDHIDEKERKVMEEKQKIILKNINITREN